MLLEVALVILVGKLVSCLRSSQSEASDAGQDVVCRLDPHEGLGIGTVGGQVQPNGVLQRTGAAMTAPAKLLVGEDGEPALHLVDPRRVGGREVQVEAWVAQQPAMDERRLVSAVIVQDEVHVQVGWHLRMDAVQELAELGRAMAGWSSPITLPVATSKAANSEVVPWRL